MAQVVNSLGHWSLAGLRQCCSKTTAPRLLGIVRGRSQARSNQTMSTNCCKAGHSYNIKLLNLETSCLTARVADFSTASTWGRYATHRLQGLTGSSTFHRTMNIFSKCQARGLHRQPWPGGLSLQVEHLGSFPACRRHFTSGAQMYVSSLTVKRPLRKKTARVAEEEKVCNGNSNRSLL